MPATGAGVTGTPLTEKTLPSPTAQKGTRTATVKEAAPASTLSIVMIVVEVVETGKPASCVTTAVPPGRAQVRVELAKRLT